MLEESRSFPDLGRLRAKLRNSVVALTAGVLCAPVALSEVAEHSWRIDVEPYIWVLADDIDVTAGSDKVSLDTDVGDEVAGGFLAEFGRGRWAIMVELSYLDDEFDTRSGGVGVELNRELVGAEMLLGYHLIDKPAHRLTLMAGGDYGELDLKLKFSPSGRVVRETEDWGNPLLGARYQSNLSDWWALELKGLVGGFGVGLDSTYTVQGKIDYEFSEGTRVFAGYRVVRTEYDESGFEFDSTRHGPVAGIRHSFR